MGLAGIGWLRGLDKILPKTGFCIISGAGRTADGKPRVTSLVHSDVEVVREEAQVILTSDKFLIGWKKSFAS
jgi:hypothetical protein